MLSRYERELDDGLVDPPTSRGPARRRSWAVNYDDDGLDDGLVDPPAPATANTRRLPASPSRPHQGGSLMRAVRQRNSSEVSTVSRATRAGSVADTVQRRLNLHTKRSADKTALPATSRGSDNGPKPATNQADTVLPVNVQELRQLSKALTLRATGASKKDAIEQAFGCKKGGGPVWRRASALFDAALGES